MNLSWLYLGLSLMISQPAPVDRFDAAGRYWQTTENPSETVIRARLGKSSSAVWQSRPNTLTFAHAGSVPSKIMLCCGFQTEVEAITPKLHAVSIEMQQLEQAVFSWAFMVVQGKMLTPERIWRGAKAAPAPKRQVIPQERLKTHVWQSRELGSSRTMRLYLPPEFNPKTRYPVIYMADGQQLTEFAPILEMAIRQKQLQPVVVIGMDNKENRFEEYAQAGSFDFLRFERFIYNELIPQLEQRYQIQAQVRYLFGFSNGADWVVRILGRQPQHWAGGIAFSPMNYTDFQLPAKAPRPKLYLLAGIYDDTAYYAARDIKEAAQKDGLPVIYKQQVGGHDQIIWEEALPEALRWLLK